MLCISRESGGAIATLLSHGPLDRHEIKARRNSITTLTINFGSDCTLTQAAIFGYSIPLLLGQRPFQSLCKVDIDCGGGPVFWFNVCVAIKHILPVARRGIPGLAWITPSVKLIVRQLAPERTTNDRLLGDNDRTAAARKAYLDAFPDARTYATREEILNDVWMEASPVPTLNLLEAIDELLLNPYSSDSDIDRLCTKVEYGILSPVTRAQLYHALDSAQTFEPFLLDFKRRREERTLHEMLLSSRRGGDVGELSHSIDDLVSTLLTEGYVWDSKPSAHAQLYDFIGAGGFKAVTFIGCKDMYFITRMLETLFANSKPAIERLTFDDCDLTRFDYALLSKGGFKFSALQTLHLLNNRPGVEKRFKNELHEHLRTANRKFGGVIYEEGVRDT